MWFHVCTGASGNGCSIAHSVRDLPGEASGLDSQRFAEIDRDKLIDRDRLELVGLLEDF